MSVMIAIGWSVAFGFVTAGFVAAVYRMFTSEQPSFSLLQTGDAKAMLAVPLLAVTGPAVLARNSWRGRVLEGRGWGWIAAGGALAGGWSFILGVFVLHFYLSLAA
jgi:hypothetical protein